MNVSDIVVGAAYSIKRNSNISELSMSNLLYLSVSEHVSVGYDVDIYTMVR